MATEIQETTSRQRQRRAIPIIDTDVHHGVANKSELYPYLSRYYAERFADYGFGVGTSHANNGGFRGRRADTVNIEEPQPDNIGTLAISVEDTRSQLLDGSGIDIAILSGGTALGTSAMMELDYASALSRAFNDFTMEHWVAKDSRFRYLISICHQDPVGAAAEIDRLGPDPGVVGIMMPCGATRPFGQRFYHPIYEACERHGLVLGLHFSNEGSGINPAPSPAGYPSYYIESRSARPSFYSAHVASFIFEGVFETFPTLKVAMLEGGFAWVPPLMWKMDIDWKGLRHQTPWVAKLPSEYLKEHIRFSTQPMEEPDNPDAIRHIIDWMDGEHTLMFATDYPHWDWDDPDQTLTTLPDALRRRIFWDNAAETFGLSLPAAGDAS